MSDDIELALAIDYENKDINQLNNMSEKTLISMAPILISNLAINNNIPILEILLKNKKIVDSYLKSFWDGTMIYKFLDVDLLGVLKLLEKHNALKEQDYRYVCEFVPVKADNPVFSLFLTDSFSYYLKKHYKHKYKEFKLEKLKYQIGEF